MLYDRNELSPCYSLKHRMKMVVTVRYQSVKCLPNGGKVHAILRCVKCGHTKLFQEEIGNEHFRRLADHAVCSKCHSKEITLDLFSEKSAPAPQSNRQSVKNCVICGSEISELTLEVVPHTLCCSEHLNQNPPARTRIVEPMGSREDFKKDSGSNWSRARKPKF